MSRVIRSRRAPAALDQPMYARMLRLRHLTPSGLLCFVFLEGAVALGILLALAELVSWWGVLVLPAMVALMVKLNDVLAGMVTPPVASSAVAPARRSAVSERPPAIRPPVAREEVPVVRSRMGDQRERAAWLAGGRGDLSAADTVITDLGSINGASAARQWADQVDVRQQIARQSAARRYE
jgi:hypothetical protein